MKYKNKDLNSRKKVGIREIVLPLEALITENTKDNETRKAIAAGTFLFGIMGVIAFIGILCNGLKYSPDSLEYHLAYKAVEKKLDIDSNGVTDTGEWHRFYEQMHLEQEPIYPRALHYLLLKDYLEKNDDTN